MDECSNFSQTECSWENFFNWIHCICIVTFDLEQGQVLENVYPSTVSLSSQEVTNICYLAFPDSNSGCMGDTLFTITLQSSPGNQTLRKEHVKYNSLSLPVLEANGTFWWGYVYFRQVKDTTLPRGYFQKSVVILSRLPFNNLFNKISNLIAPEYFENGDVSLETVCYTINRWPTPVPGLTLSLPLLGSVFQIKIPQNGNNLCNKSGLVSSSLENQIHTPIEDSDIFSVLEPVLSHLHLLWELVITTEPIVVMASSPTHCASMVLSLTRLIAPLKYCGDFRPYFTIHDGDFKQYTNRNQGPPPVILGVTNPFFAKTLLHWPHSLKLGNGDQKCKLKKNGSAKIIDTSPGIYTSYRPLLQKDKTIFNKLVNGINLKRPLEAQSALLRKHMLELTHSFLIPLERYIASLMPLQKNILPFKAAPRPLPFNPDDFFTTLESAGPQLTTGIKGDWIGLYKKFFRSPNFSAWFNARYGELASKLQALQLEALANSNLRAWACGRSEVEVVDMILKIKDKIEKCKEGRISATDSVQTLLTQRLNDTIDCLPDTIKRVLHVS